MDEQHSHSYKVLQILAKYYKHIYTLEEYLKEVLSKNYLSPDVLRSGDTVRFTQLLRSTLVCVKEMVTPKIVSVNNFSHQREIVLRVIKRLMKRDGWKNNVLTLGCLEPSENSHMYASPLSQVEIKSSSQSSRLMYPLWTQLLERIGDEMMTYILEYTALYIFIPSSCYIQITGTPIFDLPVSQKLGSNRGVKRKYSSDSDTDDKKAKRTYSFKTEELRRMERQLQHSGIPLPFDYHRYIAKTSVLFDSSLRERFPNNFLLNFPETNGEEASKLFHKVFKNSLRFFPSLDSECGIFSELKGRIECLLREMIEKYRKCPFLTLVNHYCPIHYTHRRRKRKPLKKSSEVRKSRVRKAAYSVMKKYTNRTKPTTEKLLEDLVHNRQVYLFLRQVILRIFPEALLGSTQNRNQFLTHVKKFINLGKYERYSLGQLMRNIKIKHCLWLAELKLFSLKVHFFSELLWFLFSQLIVNILKTFLYMTDSTIYKNKIFYYRKSVWQSMRSRAVNGFIKKCHLQPISKETVEEWQLSRKCLGVSTIRFIPKAKALRPIVNMSSSSTGHGKNPSINKQLQNCLHILNYEKERNDIVGRAVFGIDDIYQAWTGFVQERKAQNDNRALYFIKTDIDKCFDTINQQKLIEILQKILLKPDQDEYITRKYCSVYLDRENVRQRFYSKVCTLTEFIPDFCNYVKRTEQQDNLRDVILVDQVFNQRVMADQLMEQLQCHICHNIIKIDSKYYIQKKGISQGSVLSVMLCNIYYGDMENERISIGSDELFLRMVDDTLFVTPDKNRAIRYLETMLNDIPDYNYHLNEEKILTSFKYKEIQQIEHGGDFPWCGMLFSTYTLNVHVDYSRYSGVSLKSALTCNMSQNPGLAIKNKLIFSMQRVSHGIYVDGRINTLESVIGSVFRMFLLTAFRFHSLASMLPHKQRVENNPNFFLGIILDMSSHFLMRTKKKMKQIHTDGILELKNNHVKWLCVKAFVLKLNHHHSQYKTLIRSLKTMMRNIQNRSKKEDKRVTDIILDISTIPPEFTSIMS